MPWGGGTCWREAARSAAAGRAGKGCPAQTLCGGWLCPLCQKQMEHSGMGRTYKVLEGEEGVGEVHR